MQRQDKVANFNTRQIAIPVSPAADSGDEAIPDILRQALDRAPGLNLPGQESDLPPISTSPFVVQWNGSPDPNSPRPSMTMPTRPPGKKESIETLERSKGSNTSHGLGIAKVKQLGRRLQLQPLTNDSYSRRSQAFTEGGNSMEIVPINDINDEWDQLEEERLEKVAQLELQRHHMRLEQQIERDESDAISNKSRKTSHSLHIADAETSAAASQESFEELGTPQFQHDAEDDDTMPIFPQREVYSLDLTKRSHRKPSQAILGDSGIGLHRSASSNAIDRRTYNSTDSAHLSPSGSMAFFGDETEFEDGSDSDFSNEEDDRSPIVAQPVSRRPPMGRSSSNTSVASTSSSKVLNSKADSPLRSIHMSMARSVDSRRTPRGSDPQGFNQPRYMLEETPMTAPLESKMPSPAEMDAFGARGRSQSESAVNKHVSLPEQKLRERPERIDEDAGLAAARAENKARRRSRSNAQRRRASPSQLVIAVVGPKNAGKSTVVSQIIRKTQSPRILKDDGENQVQAYRTSTLLDGRVHTVQVLEVDSALLQFGKEGLIWPSFLPPLDGAMLCYDASDVKSVPPLKKLLTAFWTRGGMKLILLACKSATRASLNAANPVEVAHFAVPFGAGLVQLDGGVEDTNKKMRTSFKYVCKNIVEAQFPQFSNTVRKRAHEGEEPLSPVSSRNTDKVTSPTSSTSLAGTPVSLVPSSGGNATVPELDLYFSKEDLIEKFLLAAVAENDNAYVITFLTVYRRFATPHEVLANLIARHAFVGRNLQTEPMLARFVQTRLASLLADWITLYPSDFIYPATFQSLVPFLDSLVLTPWTAHYAESVTEAAALRSMPDVEGPWALLDHGSGEESPVVTRSRSFAPSLSSQSGDLLQRQPSNFSVEEAKAALSASKRPRGLSDADSANSSEQPRSARYSSTLRKVAEDPLLAISNDLMGFEEHLIAVQITRLAWDIFRNISPRDLLRHVLAPRDPRKANAPLMQNQRNPVAQSIAFVNFLSNWVATMILVQNKGRMRSRMIEKFIGIAAHLRDLDNMDSLMGVLAGLNAQPVYRLEPDWESVKAKPIFKKFRSLNRLMGSVKSFGAYRIALSTSGCELIPYLGCHLQDITRVLEGKDDNKNGMINWTKQSQIAKASMVVIDCPRFAPNLPIDTAIERLILDVPVHNLEDDSLYHLSYSYKPRTSKPASKLRKLFEQITQPDA